MDTDLEKWISSENLSSEAMARVTAALHDTPEKTAVVDNFLTPDRFDTLRHLFWDDGAFEQKFQLAGGHGKVDAETFEAAQDKDRFLTHLQLVGPRKGREMQNSILQDLLFRQFLRGPALRYFSACLGASLNRVENINAKILTRTHFLRPHSDRLPGRRICCVLYTSTDWMPELGGRFELYRGGEILRTIDPIANRLVLFQPGSDCLHAVEPFSEAGRDWRRCNYSFWYN